MAAAAVLGVRLPPDFAQDTERLRGFEHEARAASATYLPNLPAAGCPKDALLVRRDDKGRLVLPAASADVIDSFAGSAVVIYLEKAQP